MTSDRSSSPVRPAESLGQRMIRGSLWCALDGWASEAANLVIFLVLARVLGPEAFGLVALAMVFTTVVTDLGGYAITRVLVQRHELPARMIDSVFWLVTGLAISAAAAFFALAPWIAAAFSAEGLEPILRWLAFTVVLNGAGAVPLALLSRELQFASIAKRSLLMIGAGGITGVSLAFAGAGPFALVGQALGQAVVSFLVLFGAVTWRPRLRFSPGDLADVRAYVTSVVGNRLVTLADERGPQLLIGLLISPTAVGYFSIGVRLIEVLNRIFVVPVNQVTLPGVARAQGEPEQVRGIMAMGLIAASLASVPAFLGTAVLAPDALLLFLGKAWLPTVPVLQLLALRGLAWPAVLQGNALLFGVGEPGRLLRINLVDLAVNFTSLLIAAPFGLWAVAAASSLRILLVRWPMSARAIAPLSRLHFRQQVQLLAPAWLAGLLMVGTLLIWRPYFAQGVAPGLAIALSVMAGAAVYGAAMLLLQPGILGWLKQLRAHLGGNAVAVAPGGQA